MDKEFEKKKKKMLTLNSWVNLMPSNLLGNYRPGKSLRENLPNAIFLKINMQHARLCNIQQHLKMCNINFPHATSD